MALTNPFEQGQGDQLVNPENFPNAIRHYLAQEELLLDHLLPFDTLVEVGCMHGRYLNWCLKKRVAYLGVEPVERYAKRATERIEACENGVIPRRVVQLDAAHIPCLGLSPDPLLFFPFNSLGNMKDVPQVLDGLAGTRKRFLICSYSDDPIATACRQAYYQKSGFTDLELIDTPEGKRFISISTGLDTTGFRKAYLEGIFDHLKVAARTIPFGDIGVAYLGGADPSQGLCVIPSSMNPLALG